MSQKEEWIEHTMRTEDFIQSVTTSDELLNKLRGIPTSVKEGYEKIPKSVVWAIAASIAVLITLNIFAVSKYDKNSTEMASQETEISESYFSYLKHI